MAILAFNCSDHAPTYKKELHLGVQTVTHISRVCYPSFLRSDMQAMCDNANNQAPTKHCLFS